MRVEGGLHERPLNAAATPVHETNFGEAGVGSGVQVLLDDRHDVAGLEAVKVEFRRDGQPDRVVVDGILHDDPFRPGYAFVCVALTLVLMPPRAEKLPVTVMRLGESAATRSSRIWFVAAS